MYAHPSRFPNLRRASHSPRSFASALHPFQFPTTVLTLFYFSFPKTTLRYFREPRVLFNWRVSLRAYERTDSCIFCFFSIYFSSIVERLFLRRFSTFRVNSSNIVPLSWQELPSVGCNATLVPESMSSRIGCTRDRKAFGSVTLSENSRMIDD